LESRSRQEASITGSQFQSLFSWMNRSKVFAQQGHHGCTQTRLVGGTIQVLVLAPHYQYISLLQFFKIAE
jgi:hypothetical protein